MDFLDLCEHAAALARKEADLIARERSARTRSAFAEARQLAREIKV